MRRYHDHGNTYNGKHLIGGGYNFRGLTHYLHGETRQCTGRHGAREGAKSPTFWSAGNRKWTGTLGVAWVRETSKPIPTVIHFLQQGHNYCNNATPPNSGHPYEFMGLIIFKLPQYLTNQVEDKTGKDVKKQKFRYNWVYLPTYSKVDFLAWSLSELSISCVPRMYICVPPF